MIFLLLFFACKEQTKTVPEKTEKEAPKTKIIINKDMFDVRKHVTKILNDEVYPSDDDETFRCLDAILKSDTNEHDFYMMVFRDIIKKSDGALAEVMGQYILDFIKEKPKYFVEKYKTFANEEKEQWIGFMAYEFYFQEDYKTEVNRYFDNILRSIATDSGKETITKLQEKVMNEVANIDSDESEHDTNLTSKLKQKVMRLSELEHEYQLKSLEIVPSEKTIVLGGLQRVLKLKDTIEFIDVSLFQKGIHEIRKSFLKGAKPMEVNGNTYPRVTIEEYIFKTSKNAKETYEMLLNSKGKSSAWTYISKAPHKFLLEENRLYFVGSGGFYMMGMCDEIVEKIKD
ncbi:hypothetical protein KAOT1_16988 [Kordia algicida OT-1]|uniref:Uncharacterized protein n=2 Tax=Kordia TaxID=221065 RepID=A9DS32_9FLAO|nr:hypothetical protein KAOT1_16988 [Kordia algicida OT-1]